MNLFSKLRDYNEELEEILERKYFSSSIKSLLLSMIYKIEMSYRDYERVKRVVRTKNEFLTELVDTINKNCDNLKTVQPDTKDAELLEKYKVLALTNEKERSLLAYPTEISLLYGISDIKPKYFYIKSERIFKKLLQDMLVEGYNTNNLEILANFNGWSWDTKNKSNGKYINNLIYQDFLFLCGENFLTEWRNTSSDKRDYFAEIEKMVEELDKDNEFILNVCKVLYAKASDKEKAAIAEKLKQQSKELTKISNKEKFLENMRNKKRKLSDELQKYDMILSDEKLLEKEFKKRNKKLEEDKQIGNIKIFENMIARERERAFVEFREASDLSLPVNYLKYKKKLEHYVAIYKNKNSVDKDIIALQKSFLRLIEKRVSKAQGPEIIEYLYILRYIKNINLSKDYQIRDIQELNQYIDKILKTAITKACKAGIIKIICMDINTNYEIIKFAIDSKIIELEEIKIKIELNKDCLNLKIYDKEIFDKETNLKYSGSKKDLVIKMRKNTKLFN